MPLDLVAYLAQHLVNQPEQIKVTAQKDGRQTTINIYCAEADAGRIIGKNGRIINSIRTLARATNEGRENIEVKLIDTVDNTVDDSAEDTFTKDFDEDFDVDQELENLE